MLRKHDGIEIDPKDPFASDKLERSHHIKNLTRLIQSISQPFVLSVEAPWGHGKTTFIQIWKAYLETDSIPCVYFNAWETDYVDDPLLPFIGEIKPLVEKEIAEAENGSLLREHWQSIRRIGGGVLRKSLPLALQLMTHGLLSREDFKAGSDLAKEIGEEVSKFASEYAEERIRKYEEERNSIVLFKTQLEEMASILSDDADSKCPLIFFVDELDRCRPDYALALLERMKHIFSVPGIVFILSVDRDQLRNTIRSIYGDGIDADGYLRRFIDLRYRLPEPDITPFCSFLFEKFNIKEALGVRDKRLREADLLLKWIEELAVGFSLTLREIEQCFTEMNLVLRTTSPRYLIFPEYLVYLVVLKSKAPEIFEILKNKLTIDEFDSLSKQLQLLPPVDGRLAARFEASLISGYLSEHDRDLKLAELRQMISNTDKPNYELTPEQSRAQSIVSDIEQEFHYQYRDAISYLVKRIDLTRDFLPELNEIDKSANSA